MKLLVVVPGFGTPYFKEKKEFLKRNIERIRNTYTGDIDLRIFNYSDEKSNVSFEGVNVIEFMSKGYVGQFIYKYVTPTFVDNYDYIIVILDDIELKDTVNVDEILNNLSHYGYDILSPTLSEDSMITHKYMISDKTRSQSIRHTRCMEFFCYFMTNKTYKKWYALFNENSCWLWGLDLSYGVQNIKCGLLESIEMIHYIKSGGNYGKDKPDPRKELDENMTRLNIPYDSTKTAELQHKFIVGYDTYLLNNIKPKIGIFIRIQNMYSNGLGQNAVFLKQAFKNNGYHVDFIAVEKSSDTNHHSVIMPVLNISNINISLYTAFICTTIIPTPEVIQKIKSYNKPLINYIGYNVQMYHNEHLLYTCKPASIPSPEHDMYSLFNACWLSDAQTKSSLMYLQLLNKNKIKIEPTPLVWDTTFIKTSGIIPQYNPNPSESVNIIIMEPNINYCKTMLTPLMACEKLYLENPACIKKVHIFNTPEKVKWGKDLIKSLTLYTDKKITMYARLPITEILSFFKDEKTCFVFNHLELPLNYAYFEALYTGFPVVHNSIELREGGVGYYYDTLSNTSDALKKAIFEHTICESLDKNHKYLDRFNPSNEQVKRRLNILLDKAIVDTNCKKSITSPLLISYDNKPNEYTHNLIKSLDQQKWNYKMVGEGDVWNGVITKFHGYKDYLETLDNDIVVILSDARDVLCVRSPHRFMEGFNSFNADIVVSMEQFCGGKFNLDTTTHYCSQCMPLDAYWKYHNITPLPNNKFVNSGLICGKVGALKTFLEWSLSNKYKDDQYALGCYMNKFPNRVRADYELKLLHTTTFGAFSGMKDIHIQATDAPQLAEILGRKAFFLHIPGIAWHPGQRILYNTINDLIKDDTNDESFRRDYNYSEPEWV